MAVGALPNKQLEVAPVAGAVADMYTHTMVVQVILDRVTQAELVFGKVLALLAVEVAVDLQVKAKAVTEMRAEQAAQELPYWDLA
jgi:hypothetical protein